MRRTGTLFLALGLVCFSLAGCSNGGGEEDQFSAPETSDQDDTEAGVDVVETVDIRQADEISAPDLEIHFPDLQETVDIVVPPETTDEVEILVEIEVEVLPEIEDEYVPPPSDVGQECDSELDCDTNGGCVLGFCTVICRADGEEIDGACDNSNPDSDWGLVFQCPADVDVCMPGDVAGVEITCQTDSFCLEAGLAGFACAGALPFAGVELAGRCVPKGDRKPAGAACQGDGDSCISLLCVNENLDPDKKGRCSGYCEAGDNVPDDTVCSMLPIFDEDGAAEGVEQDVNSSLQHHLLCHDLERFRVEHRVADMSRAPVVPSGGMPLVETVDDLLRDATDDLVSMYIEEGEQGEPHRRVAAQEAALLNQNCLGAVARG